MKIAELFLKLNKKAMSLDGKDTDNNPNEDNEGGASSEQPNSQGMPPESEANATPPNDQNTEEGSSEHEEAGSDTSEEDVSAKENMDEGVEGEEEPLVPPCYDNVDPPCSRINYEDLGTQLGLNKDESAKQKHIALLNQYISAIKKDITDKHNEALESQEKQAEFLDNLVNKRLLVNLNRIDQQINQALQRLLAHGGALRALQFSNDEERKNKLLDLATNQLGEILEGARQELEKYKRVLNETLPAGSWIEDKAKLEREYKDRIKQLTHQYRFKIDLENGYLYGESVIDFLQGKKEDNASGGSTPK